MNMQCQQCGSTELTKLSLVYAEGFSNLEARSRGWGLIFGGVGADLAFGKLRTKGKIQTQLSQKASPPRKWSYWRIVFWDLVGLPVLVFILGIAGGQLPFAGNFTQQLAWFGLPYLGLVAAILILAFWKNIWVFPRKYKHWDRSFMCRSCGHVLQIAQASDSGRPTLIREAQQ